MSQRSPLILPNKLTAPSTEASVAPPFVCDTVQRTVVKFAASPFHQQTIATPEPSEAVLTAMQRLVAIINTLQSSPIASLEAASKQRPSETQMLDALFPYVSEEAYDVLDALQSGGPQQAQHLDCKAQTGVSLESQYGDVSLSNLEGYPKQSFISHPSPPHPLTTIETLIPYLLWCLVRSAYSTMQLIEGVKSRCWQPERGWASGMLRLVVMLEAETPTRQWCFDIATGYPAEQLLESTAIIQAEEPVLLLQQPVSTDDVPGAACQVDRQLKAILQSLQAERLGLKPFLEGVAVELLQPGTDWQTGNLKLRLGFEFTAQPGETASTHNHVRLHPELIEAELLDEVVEITTDKASQCSEGSVTRSIAGLITKTHVSVRGPIGESLSSDTLVYVTDADSLKRSTPLMTRQQCAQSLGQLQRQQTSGNEENAQLKYIVQAAIAYTHQFDTTRKSLLQPMLLMDELVPKLLWSLTSSTYEIMQLLGGLPAQVLQSPGNWQQGTLRLVAALHLKAADLNYMLDLSTGRSVLTVAPKLAGDAIVQVGTNNTVGSQLILMGTLTDRLQQQFTDTIFEYELLQDGVAITWLEGVEQDWQTGSMQLNLNLAFIADAP